MNQLTVSGIITNAIQIGIKNVASIIGAVILWILTIWIPYINVGTTIAMIGLVVAISKGGVISPTEIFNAKYRKNMGEFFLLMIFLMMGVYGGMIFFIIPGMVIAIAWGQAVYLLIDKDLNPTEALAVSNKITYGKKWTIFLGQFILAVVMMIAVFIISYIFGSIADILGMLAGLAGYVVLIAVMMAASAYIYGELSKEA